ncbi:hypothetical protein B0H16DRAFT_1632745, partial [Mycena metata]
MKASALSLLLAVAALVEESPSSVLSKAIDLRAQGSPETCGNNGDLVPLFQLYDAAKTVHYYTADDSQVTADIKKGVYVFNGVAALVFPTAEVSTVPYFFTTAQTERSDALTAGGYSDCGITGYIYPTQICGSVPLYRAHFIAANTDYLYTTSAADRDNAVENQGFTDEGVAGYVLELAS